MIKMVIKTKKTVIPLLVGNINNLYLWIFSLAVSSPTLIKKESPLLSQLPLSTCEDNCPSSQEATSIYLENPELTPPSN